MNSSVQPLYFLAFVLCFQVVHSVRAQEHGESKKTGTAFVVRSDGCLLTCMHVVADAAKVEVAIGGKSYQATVLALNAKTDLALLRIEAKELTALPLADSGAVEVGEESHAFGFPLASVLGDSVKVTRGTVSGIETKEGQTVLQIDATINQGNSGGPVVNEKGEVVGVISARLAGAVVSSVGLAIPVNYAKTLLRENEVQFATDGAKTKLDGPMLVKRVSPALALVTVTPNILTHAESVSSVAFSPDGRSLVSANTSGGLKVWNVQTRECTRALDGHVNSRVTSVAFSIGGKMLAGVGYFNDKTVKLWDTETWKMKRTLTGHSDWVISVAFSPNGVTLATGSLDHTIKLWNAETGELMRTLTEHTNSASIAFSADGKMFLRAEAATTT